MRIASPLSILLLAAVTVFFSVTDAQTLVRVFTAPDCCAGCDEAEADDCCTPDGDCAAGCTFCACPGRCVPALVAGDEIPVLDAIALVPPLHSRSLLSGIIDIPPHPPRFA